MPTRVPPSAPPRESGAGPGGASARGELRDVLLVTLLLRAAALAAGLLWLWNTICVRQLVVDVFVWGDFLRSVRSGLVPYVHFTREYPVGAGLLYTFLAWFVDPDAGKQAILAHAAFITAVDVVNVVLFHRILRRVAPERAAVLALLFGVNLTALALASVRFESVVVTFVLLGLDAHLRGRPRLAAAFWSAGAAIKWFPAVFLAVQEYRALVVDRKRWQWLGSGLVFAAIVGLVNVPFAVGDWTVHGHLDHWLYPYRYHVQRPLYWDTVLGVAQLWLGALSFERWASASSLALMALAVVAPPRLSFERKGVLVCLAAVFLNRVYSPQFHLWFYPLLLLDMARDRGAPLLRSLALFALIDVLNVVVYPLALPQGFEETVFGPGTGPIGGGPWTVVMSVAVVARAVVLVLLAAHLVRRGRMP